jgi:hypothetical protein
MVLNNQQPVQWDPVGVSDTVDGSNVFKGAMEYLRNLVPDPSTRNIFVPKPAATLMTDFSTSGIADPGFISCYEVVGDRVYGMIATSSPSGKDIPFVYDIAGDTFITVSGITAGNTPNSVSTTGPWTPPTLDVIGTKIIFTHPNFGASAPIGILDISTPSAPSWSVGNTSPSSLPGVPVAVKNFAGRAYYAYQNDVLFSDILEATTITNVSQVLTMGDDAPITGFGKMPLKSLTAGSLEALFVFKAKSVNQITGDAALNSLLNSEVATGIGTESPLSISATPSGLYFISQHGLRNISVGGEVSPVIGADGGGVSVPFINSTTPSRISGGFNINTYRVNTQNSFIPTLPYQDWWFNTDLGIWTGPHTFPASLVKAYEGTFIITPQGIEGQLWQSDIVPLDSSSYIENGEQLEYLYQTCLLPSAPTMNENCIIETSVGLQFSKAGGTVNFFALDEDDVQIDLVSKTIDVDATFWDITEWGAGSWGGNVTKYQGIRVPWSKPLVFGQAKFGASGNAVNGFKIGTWSNRYQFLGYMDIR